MKKYNTDSSKKTVREIVAVSKLDNPNYIKMHQKFWELMYTMNRKADKEREAEKQAERDRIKEERKGNKKT